MAPLAGLLLTLCLLNAKSIVADETSSDSTITASKNDSPLDEKSTQIAEAVPITSGSTLAPSTKDTSSAGTSPIVNDAVNDANAVNTDGMAVETITPDPAADNANTDQSTPAVSDVTTKSADITNDSDNEETIRWSSSSDSDDEDGDAATSGSLANDNNNPNKETEGAEEENLTNDDSSDSSSDDFFSDPSFAASTDFDSSSSSSDEEGNTMAASGENNGGTNDQEPNANSFSEGSNGSNMNEETDGASNGPYNENTNSKDTVNFDSDEGDWVGAFSSSSSSDDEDGNENETGNEYETGNGYEADGISGNEGTGENEEWSYSWDSDSDSSSDENNNNNDNENAQEQGNGDVVEATTSSNGNNTAESTETNNANSQTQQPDANPQQTDTNGATDSRYNVAENTIQRQDSGEKGAGSKMTGRSKLGSILLKNKTQGKKTNDVKDSTLDEKSVNAL